MSVPSLRLVFAFSWLALAALADAQSAPPPGMTAPPPVTHGEQLAGKALRQAVARVNELEWFDELADAKARSAATGRPILWLQALGDLEGFA